MSKKIQKETAFLSAEDNAGLTELHQRAVQKIIEYFDAPYAAKANLAQEIKAANNALNSFAHLRQAESGHEMVRLQAIKMVSANKEDFKELVAENLPHLALIKKLKA
jgi:hypothetical protein